MLGQLRHLVGRDDECDGGRAVGVLVPQEGLDLAGHVSRVVGAELEDAGNPESHGGGFGHEDLRRFVIGGDERHLSDADLSRQPQNCLQFWVGQLTAKNKGPFPLSLGKRIMTIDVHKSRGSASSVIFSQGK